MTSDEFKTIRQSLSLTQKQLAEIMGITPQEVSRIESGSRPPTRLHAAFIDHLKKTQSNGVSIEEMISYILDPTSLGCASARDDSGCYDPKEECGYCVFCRLNKEK